MLKSGGGAAEQVGSASDYRPSCSVMGLASCWTDCFARGGILVAIHNVLSGHHYPSLLPTAHRRLQVHS